MSLAVWLNGMSIFSTVLLASALVPSPATGLVPLTGDMSLAVWLNGMSIFSTVLLASVLVPLVASRGPGTDFEVIRVPLSASDLVPLAAPGPVSASCLIPSSPSGLVLLPEGLDPLATPGPVSASCLIPSSPFGLVPLPEGLVPLPEGLVPSGTVSGLVPLP